jgi:CO/xanthine dehydrogenase Mo-binding subunit
MADTMSVIGAPIPRLEGPEKVTGRAIYAADIHLPGTLWGKILRSPYPHARILSIDVSRANEVPGVRAVITGKDIPNLLQGRRLRDMPVLCWDKVRFVGDRVAAVAADTAEAAEEALQRIEVEYEEIPAVYDPVEALEPDAPVIHEDKSAYEGMDRSFAYDDVPNGLTRLTWEKGDIEKGFVEADLTLEHTFRIPSRHHGYIEPHSSMIAIGDDGRIEAWICTKSPMSTRTQLAQSIGVSEDEILVHIVNVGGDFGGKGDAMDLPIAYFLAKQAGRPVKIVMSYAEELMAGNPTHPSVITIRTGVKRDGRMVARYLRAVHSSGAYGAFKPTPNVAIGGAGQAGCYRIDNTFLEAIQSYTNTVPAGFFRAPGAPQADFVIESHMDLIANELGMDPAEFRLKNIVGDDEENALGVRWQDVKARETLEAALDAAGWNKPKPGPNFGRVIAMYERFTGAGPTEAGLTANSDGSITVSVISYDQGTGLHTALQQIAANEMQVPIEQVQVVTGDTDSGELDISFGGARSTNIGAHAVVQAADKLKEELKARAARLLECPAEEVEYRNGRFNHQGDTSQGIPLSDVVSNTKDGEPVKVLAKVNIPMNNQSTSFVAQVVELEVDQETGHMKIHRFITAHDVGTVINPITHQGQIDGGVVQGLGMALMEDLGIEDGRVTNLHLGDYKLPTIADIPKLETVLIQASQGPIPYDAKAIGEMANVSPAAAIANAVADATGVRFYDLPVTAERIHRALKEKR